MTTVLEWLNKATWSTSDLTGGSNGGYLSPAQAKQFLRVAIEASALLPDVRTETSDSPKFEVPRISFGSRILKPGTEGTRLIDADRVKPTTGLVTLSTYLFRGEVPVSDETFEDNIERDRVADTIMTMVAEAVGRDIEEIAIKSDTARIGGEDTGLDQFDGIIKLMQSNLVSGQKLNSASVTTYDDLFGNLVEAMPAKYRRDYSKLRLYVPVKHADGYQKALAARGTGLGDQAIVDNLQPRLGFRGIRVKPLPLMSGTDTINSGSVDYSKFAFLTDPTNIIVGYHRKVRMEKFRDPREGATSFLPTVRFDVKFANPDAATLAYGIAL